VEKRTSVKFFCLKKSASHSILQREGGRGVRERPGAWRGVQTVIDTGLHARDSNQGGRVKKKAKPPATGGCERPFPFARRRRLKKVLEHRNRPEEGDLGGKATTKAKNTFLQVSVRASHQTTKEWGGKLHGRRKDWTRQ